MTETKNTKIEIVYSPIEDRGKDLNNSPIWKSAWKLDEISDQDKKRYMSWWMYKIKFDSLKPLQILKMERVTF